MVPEIKTPGYYVRAPSSPIREFTKHRPGVVDKVQSPEI